MGKLNERFVEKKEKVKASVKYHFGRFKRGCSENKELVTFAVVTMLPVAGKIIKSRMTKYAVDREEELREKRIYDRANGHYYYMRREPSTKEWLEIDRRKEEGEPLRYVLLDMGLLL